MNTGRKFFIGALLALVAAPAVAQDRDGDRERARELRDRIRELTEELRELEGGRFFQIGPGADFNMRMPLAINLANNRAIMGVVVRTAADPATDSIGAVIESVSEGGPAEEAGIRDGDIIVSFEGDGLTGRYPAASDFESEPAVKLIDLIGEYEPGDTVQVAYRRGRDQRTAQVVLDRRGGAWSQVFGSGDDSANVWSFRAMPEGRFDPQLFSGEAPFVIRMSANAFADVELVSLNEQLGRYFGTSQGVLVVSAPEDSPMGLRGGDVILKIGTRDIDSPSRAFRILGSYEAGEESQMEIMRDRNRRTITGTVPERDVHLRRQRRR